jgi:hypothetical protein
MTDLPRVDEDTLRALREQVQATQEAAERIVREATEHARGANSTPPRGWQPQPAQAEGAGVSAEAQALATLLDSLRALLPPDLREQVNDLIRPLLKIVRALVDLLIDRLEPGTGPRGAEPAVEDIPIS